MEYYAIVADDLTGANDTGIKICIQGYETNVIIDSNNIEKPLKEKKNILCINTFSREDKPEVAYEKVYELTQILKCNGVNKVYKKIDSVFRGNTGVEIEAFMDALDINILFLVPAIPSNGRVVKNGYLYINSNTKINVKKILEKTSNLRVEKITLNDLKKKKEFLLRKIHQLVGNDKLLILFDTEREEEFNIIANIIGECGEGLFLAGASGMASLLPEIWKIESDKASIREMYSKRDHLFIVGSYNKSTVSQLKTLFNNFEYELILIETEKVINDKNILNNIIEKINTIKSNPKRHKIMVIAVDTAMEACIIPIKEQGEKIADFISVVAKIVIESELCNTITITGGETAYHVLKSLDVCRIELIDEIASGIPVGTIIGGVADGFTLVTKSGGFGKEDAYIQILEYFYKNVSAKDVLLTNER